MAKLRTEETWQWRSIVSAAPADQVEKIIRRRRQLLVHSAVYYRMDTSLVDDHQWQAWADELVELQFFWGTEFGFFDQAFADWDASTGYHLPFTTDVFRIAERLVRDAGRN